MTGFSVASSWWMSSWTKNTSCFLWKAWWWPTAQLCKCSRRWELLGYFDIMLKIFHNISQPFYRWLLQVFLKDKFKRLEGSPLFLIMLTTIRLTIMVLDATVWPGRWLALKANESLEVKWNTKFWLFSLEVTWNTKDQGPLSIDEAITVIQTTCSGNSSTVALALLPQYHSSTSKSVVLKNRRLLEDKMVGCLDVFEISMHYIDSGHAGDRRKKSQQCHLLYTL